MKEKITKNHFQNLKEIVHNLFDSGSWGFRKSIPGNIHEEW
jgi:hypothetical protein